MSEFSLKTGSFDLALKRGPQVLATPSVVSAPVPTTLPSVPFAPVAPVVAPSAPSEVPADPEPEPVLETAPAAPVPVTGNPLKAPIVGTFYAASSPDAEPYVKVGDRVEAGQVLCIIEAMKLMNEIEAEQAGVIREITVKNGDPVEYGQVLFIIE